MDFEGGKRILYEYDAEGRIISCDASQYTPKTYEYDAKGQLKSSTAGGVTTLYQYDSYGNITAKGTALSDDTIATDGKVVYIYDSEHPDRLKQCQFYNGETVSKYNFTYDAQGNPTKHMATVCEWEKGRQLKKSGVWSYEYNPEGVRIARESTNGTRYDYEYEGTKLIRQIRTTGSEQVEIIPLYDTSDSPVGIIYNKPNVVGFTPRQYWFIKNLQGDILMLQDEEGFDVVRYSYDDWGKVTIVREMTDFNLGHENPFRWRGYVYDKETAFYYLITRYYDSRLGRFINEDDHAFLGASGNTLSYNAYTYCENDPVNSVDPMGYKAIDITESLFKTMMKNAKYLYDLATLAFCFGVIGIGALMYRFYTLVKTGGKWDLKHQKEWALKDDDWYVFNGRKLKLDDVGNIHFGFVGSVLFSPKILCLGAGTYQIISRTSSWSYWYSFFDDPRDTKAILYGVSLWKKYFKKRYLIL